MSSARVYNHFCMTARALEEVGERWSLLIVRDLLLGPRRFTDLAQSLAGITPTRLTNRLRSLQAAGIVAREPAQSGREVWYRLTDTGQDLAPALGELAFWGILHAFEPPRDGEPVHPDHVMHGTRIWLDRYGKRPSGATTWVWQFPNDYTYTLRADRGRWPAASLTRGRAERAAVTVVTTPGAWARFLTNDGGRRLPADDIEIVAKPVAAKVFARAFGARLGAG
jgi:DNA-binding HxlR family transcriptional regulator